MPNLDFHVTREQEKAFIKSLFTQGAFLIPDGDHSARKQILDFQDFVEYKLQEECQFMIYNPGKVVEVVRDIEEPSVDDYIRSPGVGYYSETLYSRRTIGDEQARGRLFLVDTWLDYVVEENYPVPEILCDFYTEVKNLLLKTGVAT